MYRPDAIDWTIIGRLVRDARTSWADLAAEVGLTGPAVATRVRRLQEAQVIRQFTAVIAPAAAGAVTAFVEVTLGTADSHEDFRRATAQLVAVQECHRLAGSAQYLLKVRARSPEELDGLLTSVLPRAAQHAVFKVSMVLATSKESPVFPLPKPAGTV